MDFAIPEPLAQLQARIRAFVAEIESMGGKALAVIVDVTDPASVRVCFDEIAAKLGAAGLIVNNAGVASSSTAIS